MSDVCPQVDGSDLDRSRPREAHRGHEDPLPPVSTADQPDDQHLPPLRDAPTLSDRALDLIDGPRQDEYASPEINLERIGVLWAWVLDLPEPIPPARVAVMMAALKMARIVHRPTPDSIVDCVGYLELFKRLSTTPDSRLPK